MNPQLSYIGAQCHQQDLQRSAQHANTASGLGGPSRLSALRRRFLSVHIGRRRSTIAVPVVHPVGRS